MRTKDAVPCVGLFMPAFLPLLAVMAVGCPEKPKPVDCTEWEIPAKFGGGCLECPEGHERVKSHGVYGICTTVGDAPCYEWEYQDSNGQTKPRAIYCSPTLEDKDGDGVSDGKDRCPLRRATHQEDVPSEFKGCPCPTVQQWEGKCIWDYCPKSEISRDHETSYHLQTKLFSSDKRATQFCTGRKQCKKYSLDANNVRVFWCERKAG